MAGPYRAAGRRRLFAAGLIAAIILVAPAVSARAETAVIVQPSWGELSSQQREILAPLSGEWDRLEFWRRRKWLEIAERYPRLAPEEQTRVQAQMKAWVKLTPEERKVARDKYRNVQKASPEQREALKKMWNEYQALPDEEKLRYQQSAAKKQPPPVPPTGRARFAPKQSVIAPVAKPAVAPPTLPPETTGGPTANQATAEAPVVPAAPTTTLSQ